LIELKISCIDFEVIEAKIEALVRGGLPKLETTLHP
jgi:hypothetical protein